MKRLRILQFNMQFGQVWDAADPDNAPINIEATIAEIKRHDADIIMLQELEHVRPDGTHTPMPPNYSRIKQELKGYDSTFSFPRPDPRELPFGVGLAIFSRWPLEPLACVNIPSPPIEFDFMGEIKTPTDRLMISANVTVEGQKVRLINTHLLAFFMLKSSSEENPGQRKLVEEELRKSDLPTILTGDFNVSKHQSLVDQFAAAGFSTAQSEEITWQRMPFVLDHVFFNDAFRCVGHEVVQSPASDHFPLVVDLELSD